MKLDSLQARFPTNDFVPGQLVSFALKDGDMRRAWAAAVRCSGTLWWCQALRGYVLHTYAQGSGYAQLDSALANAPPGTLAFGPELDSIVPDRGLRCEWTDAGHLLPDDLPSELVAEGCGASSELDKRFWWLAYPLWSEPGNARHGEHVARNVTARLMYDIHWRDPDVRTPDIWWWRPYNLHEEWTRNGFYNSWRTIVRIHEARQDTVPQLYVNGGYSFAPDAERLVHPMASTPADWTVEWDEGPERMITRDTWHSITDQQTAMLRRGDSLVALAAARLPLLVSSLEGVTASLAMGRPRDLRTRSAKATLDATGVMRGQLALEDGPWLASIEARGPGWVGRARFGAPAPALTEGVGISRPLLVDARFESGEISLAEALLPSTTIGVGPVGVYFELYGMEEGEPLDFRLSVERTDRSFFGRVAGVFGLGSASHLEIAWSEVADAPEPGGYLPRLMVIDQSDLDAGAYRLSLEAVGTDGRSLYTHNPIRLRSTSGGTEQNREFR